MKMMMKMGWRAGQPLGKKGEGHVEPISVQVKVNRSGECDRVSVILTHISICIYVYMKMGKKLSYMKAKRYILFHSVLISTLVQSFSPRSK